MQSEHLKSPSSFNLLVHFTFPSQLRDYIGQDINLATGIRDPQNSGLHEINFFFLYVKAQADISALICDIISNPGFFPLLCCYSWGGAAFLCMPTITHHRFHIPAHGSKDREWEEYPFPLATPPGSCICGFCSHFIDHADGHT